MGSSVRRAIFMFLLQLLSEITRRSYDMLTAMAVAAVSIILEQPLYVFDGGFQLSFGAIMGIGLVYPALQYHVPENKLYHMIMASVSISMTTLPLILYHYYEIPRYSVLMNICIIPTVGILVVCGMGMLFIGGISELLTGSLPATIDGILSMPCIFLLNLYERFCGVIENLPGQTWITGKPQIGLILLYYIALLLIVCFHEKLPGLIALLLVITGILLMTTKVNTGLTITSIDVGQGDCFFIRSETNHVYLIDAGSSSRNKVGTYQTIPYLKSQGVNQIEAIFVSHADSDHMNGVLEIMEQAQTGNGIQVKQLVLPKIANIHKDDGYRELEQTAYENEIPIVYMKAGDMLTDGRLRVTSLHPSEQFIPTDSNSYSNVLWVSFDEFDGLFTGDVEANGEEALLNTLYKWKNQEKLNSMELLKVAHHGSKNSTPLSMLELLEPEISVISCGEQNHYGHPHEELLERLEKIQTKTYRTDECGAITIKTNGKQMTISTSSDTMMERNIGKQG